MSEPARFNFLGNSMIPKGEYIAAGFDAITKETT